MTKNSYEIINPNTGEIVSFETSVDIDLLEEYNKWVIENKLNPPTYSPAEFARHIEIEATLKNVVKALEFIGFYKKGTAFHPDMVDTLERILKNEE
jgi:uncharacterized membrane protein